MSQEVPKSGADPAILRTLKVVRLREGVFADGSAVGEREAAFRVKHVVNVSADLDASEGVTACCRVHFAPGTLVEVPDMTMALHSQDLESLEVHSACRRRAGLPAGMPQRRTTNVAKVVAHEGGVPAFKRSSVSVRVTAQWSVNNPVVYANHAAGSECVDLAISGPGESDIIAHFQFTNPLDVLTAGHNLVSAGLSLGKTLGIDIGQFQVAAPPARSSSGENEPEASIGDSAEGSG